MEQDLKRKKNDAQSIPDVRGILREILSSVWNRRVDVRKEKKSIYLFSHPVSHVAVYRFEKLFDIWS